VLEVLKVHQELKVLVLKVLRVLKVPMLFAVLGFPAIAAAQDEPRGYIQGVVGTARTEETDSAYAGLGAWRVNRWFEVFGEVGRIRNAINTDLSDRLAAAEATIRASNQTQFNTAFPVVFEPRVNVWYGLGGLRFRGPSAGPLSTYAEGGLGGARTDPRVRLSVNGENLDNEAAAIVGFGEGSQQLEMLAGGGGGVALQVWKRIRIEGGYRYMRIFGDAKTNINRIHVGAGWSF
jgi:opacity protein-like surface antigen